MLPTKVDEQPERELFTGILETSPLLSIRRTVYLRRGYRHKKSQRGNAPSAAN